MLSIGTVRMSWVPGYLYELEGPCGWRNVSFTWLSSWMISNRQAKHYFPSHKHATKPTINSGGRSFVLRVTSLLSGSVRSWMVTDSNFSVWDGNKWEQFSCTWNCARLVKASLMKMLFSFIIFHAAIAKVNRWQSCGCPIKQLARNHIIWSLYGLCKLARAPSRFTVPPRPSQDPFPCKVAEKCHSADMPNHPWPKVFLAADLSWTSCRMQLAP